MRKRDIQVGYGSEENSGKNLTSEIRQVAINCGILQSLTQRYSIRMPTKNPPLVQPGQIPEDSAPVDHKGTDTLASKEQ